MICVLFRSLLVEKDAEAGARVRAGQWRVSDSKRAHAARGCTRDALRAPRIRTSYPYVPAGNASWPGPTFEVSCKPAMPGPFMAFTSSHVSIGVW